MERILSNHTEVESLGELNEFALELTRGVRRHGAPADRRHFIEMSSLTNFDDLGRAYLNSVSSRRGTEASIYRQIAAELFVLRFDS